MDPIRFCFGLHLHQPVGNFDYVFEDHVRDVYHPFLDAVEERGFFPVTLHISGPLLDWLEVHDRRYLDRMGRLAADGRVELLLAGYYEPVLASLPRADRLEQLAWMRDALHSRFGVDADGLWLTERVWEPDLAADLADAEIRFALVDDRHFLVSGFEREALHGHYVTEHGGKRVALFPIDERLRYLIPFQPPTDTVTYLRSLRDRGERLAVLADDGEKFGGWPGTKEWVYDKGWLRDFMVAIETAGTKGEVQLSTFADALQAIPSRGLAYLSTASYREMEGWSLPPAMARRLAAVEQTVGADRVAGPDGALLRGSHWRAFQVRYAESNRMHKKMLALSALCRARGNPVGPRRAIGRAQCNDAYWHGVFGGLYLPFLRAAIWHHLADAEAELRAGEALTAERVDIDYDGREELWVHSSACSVIVAPHRGGAIEELTRFADRANFADALTRRREAYHLEAAERAESQPTHARAVITDEVTALASDAAPSIHDTEHQVRLAELPPADLDDRAIFIERVVGADVTLEAFVACRYTPLASFAPSSMSAEVTVDAEGAAIVLATTDQRLRKRLRVFPDGRVHASFEWDRGLGPAGSWFTTELSLDRARAVTASAGAEVWTYDVETVAMSERGLDRTKQGVAWVVRFPIAAGSGAVHLD
jgi:alpha-amylase